MEIKFKKLHENATLPTYAKAGDAGMDLTAVSVEVIIKPDEGYYYVEYGTGLATEIPDGHVGLLFPRSSISKTGLIMANSVGVVDSGYRGEIKLRFKVDNGVFGDLGDKTATYKPGSKVGQLMILPYPTVTPVLTDNLNDTDRGSGGFGSTGT